MQTTEFLENLEKLMDLSPVAPTTIMCAEAIPAALLTAFARMEGTKITYPRAGDSGNLKLTFDAL